MSWRHAHGRVLRWWWCGSVRCAGWSRVVLRAAPRETNTRVSDGVSLHLVDGHLGSVALNELNEAAALSGWNLHVGDLSKALEERSELVLGNVARQSSDKDSGVVWVGELVHGLRSTIIVHGRRSVHAIHAGSRLHTLTHWWATTTLHRHTGWSTTARLVLGCSSGDAHRSVSAVNALHLGQGALLVLLVGETDEAITA